MSGRLPLACIEEGVAGLVDLGAYEDAVGEAREQEGLEGGAVAHPGARVHERDVQAVRLGADRLDGELPQRLRRVVDRKQQHRVVEAAHRQILNNTSKLMFEHDDSIGKFRKKNISHFNVSINL